jgi:hypothetical protein
MAGPFVRRHDTIQQATDIRETRVASAMAGLTRDKNHLPLASRAAACEPSVSDTAEEAMGVRNAGVMNPARFEPRANCKAIIPGDGKKARVSLFQPGSGAVAVVR